MMSIITSESPSGSQDLTMERSLNYMPPEILFIIFECLPPKTLVRCRQVCTSWRDIIDTILHSDNKWKQFCKLDYPKIYEGAMWKTPDIETWFEMYRALSLWSCLDKAQESVVEICHSESISVEIHSISMQKKGLIMVLNTFGVVYYDLQSMSVAKRKGVSGYFLSLIELEDVVVTLGNSQDLRIVNKAHQDWHSDLLLIVPQQNEAVFTNVLARERFLVENRTVFFINFHSDVYAFHLDQKTLTCITLGDHMEPNTYYVLAIGFKNGCLYILTMEGELYCYDKGSTSLKCTLDISSNLMDCLYQHNMLENLEWRNYYTLLAALKNLNRMTITNFIRKMQVYGDELFFVGTISGALNIYYKPFIDGQLNLMQFSPIKSFPIPTNPNITLLSVYPVINIQVVETKEGHIILMCMAREIRVITYRHKLSLM